MTLEIPANDHGNIRVFALDGPPPADLTEKSPDALQRLFGDATLNPDFIDIVRVSDLAGLSLSDYIKQGYDIPPDSVDDAALRQVKDTAILIMSRASAGRTASLILAGGVRHVTTCSLPANLQPAAPLHSDSASGIIADPPQPKPKSDAAMSGRVAMIALIVLFALVGLMIWIAG